MTQKRYEPFYTEEDVRELLEKIELLDKRVRQLVWNEIANHADKLQDQIGECVSPRGKAQRPPLPLDLGFWSVSEIGRVVF
jgi:hypothetical protein